MTKKGNYDWQSGYMEAKELIRLENPPTAIFTANDLMAIGAMKAIRESGRKIPADISLVGYDDINMAYLCTPQLTTVRQPKYEIGVTCVKLLIKRLADSKNEEMLKGQTVTMDTEIVIRETLGYAKD